MTDIVYFLQSGDKRRVKIGYTSNLQSRMLTIVSEMNFRLFPEEAQQFGDGIQCIGYLPGSISLEKKLHEQFSEYRYGHRRSEWFTLSAELAEFILTETRPFLGFNEDGQPIDSSEGQPIIELDGKKRQSVTINRGVYEALLYISAENGAGINFLIDEVLRAYVDVVLPQVSATQAA